MKSSGSTAMIARQSGDSSVIITMELAIKLQQQQMNTDGKKILSDVRRFLY